MMRRKGSRRRIDSNRQMRRFKRANAQISDLKEAWAFGHDDTEDGDDQWEPTVRR